MQTSYDILPATGFAGQVISGALSATMTAITAAAYSYGVVLVTDRTSGVDRRQGILPAASGDLAVGEVMGILIRREMDEPGPVPAGSVRDVLYMGEVLMYAETAVSRDTFAFVRYTANGALAPGSLRADDDTSRAAQVTGLRFLETTTAAGLVRVRVNLQ